MQRNCSTRDDQKIRYGAAAQHGSDSAGGGDLEKRIMLKDCCDANTVGWMRENRQSRDDLKRKVSTENGSEEKIARALLGMAFAQTTGARDKPAEMGMCLNNGRDCRRKKSFGAAGQR
jgi:hypothetical protein